MPPKIPVESKKMMLKVYDYFVADFENYPYITFFMTSLSKWSNESFLKVLLFS
jgi:hypothetical protein